ncbi:MAG: SPOR domain-containing protein [Cellvibrionaceae bacterium]|nr:SPOR domain-containing protein [Cellvibrionaceae bacterium]
MLKKLGLFGLLLLAIGTGLTLYFPEPEITAPPLAAFTVLEQSLTTPVDSTQLRNSYAVFQHNSDQPPAYGLQLGIYKQLINAEHAAMTLGKLAASPLPVIFKVKDRQRQWFVMALGPFHTQDALSAAKKQLTEKAINNQTINWPLLNP